MVPWWERRGKRPQSQRTTARPCGVVVRRHTVSMCTTNQKPKTKPISSKAADAALSQPAVSSAKQLTQRGVGATPTAASAAAGAPASAPPAGNAWLTATGGSGRGGGSKKRGADGRIGVGAPVGEGFDGLDDDSSSLPKSPTLRERLRSSMWRMAALARMGASERDGEEGERLEPRRWQRRTKDGSYGRDLWEPQTAVRV